MTIEEELIELFDKMAEDPRFNMPTKDPVVVNIAENLQDERDDCRERLMKQEKTIDDLCGNAAYYRHTIAEQQIAINEANRLLKKYGAEILCLRKMYDGVWDKVHDRDSIIEALEAELSVRKQDSDVLLKVVEEVRQCEGAGEHRTAVQFYRITTLVEDYLDIPEPPIEEKNYITVKIAYPEMPQR